MPLTSRDSLSRLAIQQIAGSAGSTRYLGRESRPPKTDFEDLSRPENFLIVRIVSLCVGVRPRHNSDRPGGIVPSKLREVPVPFWEEKMTHKEELRRRFRPEHCFSPQPWKKKRKRSLQMMFDYKRWKI